MQGEIRILFVNGQAESRLQAQEFLKGHFSVFLAESCERAQDVLRANTVDLVFFEKNSGRPDWLASVKEQFPEIPVILVSDSGDAGEAQSLGAFDLLKRPFTSEELRFAAEKGARLVRLQRDLNDSRARLVSSERLANLGLMAGGIAHEINTPLSIMHLNSELVLIEMETAGVRNERIADLTNKTSDMVFRVSKIIKSLLSFARGDRGGPLRDVPLRDIVQDVLGLCLHRLSEQHIRVDIDPSLDGGAAGSIQIPCREHEIAQVLFNLISNAADAVKNLDQKWIRLSCREAGEQVHLFISDSGTGLSREVREKIFTPFFTTKEIGKGTGLGLSVSLGLVKSHDGSIEIDDTNPNTTFVVKLPRSPRKTAESPRVPNNDSHALSP